MDKSVSLVQLLSPLGYPPHCPNPHLLQRYIVDLYTIMSAKTILPSIEDKPVKRVLRHRISSAYFKDGGWTQDVQEAHSFSDVVEAAETCARYGLSDVELALRYDAAATDLFCVPLR